MMSGKQFVFWVMLLVFVFPLLIFGCGAEPTVVKEQEATSQFNLTQTESIYQVTKTARQATSDMYQATIDARPKTWRVTKSTGLYDRAHVDAEMLEELPVGTRVIDISEKNTFSECAWTEGIKLCRVVVFETGHKGWVIEKWLDD